MKYVSGTCLVVFTATALALIFGAGWRLSAETAPVAEPAVSPVETTEETVGPEEEVGPTVAITPTGLISFDFREAPIRDVLRLFARQVQINVVATASVQGTITMKLDNVKWRKALDLILEVNKLKMTEDKENNVIKVMTETEVAAEPMTTKVYSLKYLQAADYEVESVEYESGKKQKVTKKMSGAATMLKPLLAESETMQADPGGNKLIVHAIPAAHDRLLAAIDELDRQTMQVLIEVKFIEASTEAQKNLGIRWDFLREYGVEASGLSRTYSKGIKDLFEGKSNASDKRSLSESIKASGEDQSKWARNRTDEAGTKTRGYVADTSEGLKWEDSMDATGLRESSLTRDLSGSSLASFSRDITHNAEQGLGWDRSRTEDRNVVRTANLTADSVRLVLSALFEDTDVKLVSNPRISTVDNKQATIRAVKEFPIPRWTYNAETGGWEVQGFDYKDIGITLKVTPHINEENFITLDVDPEVSNQSGSVVFGGGTGGTAEIPIVDSRTATTRVVVRSGETLVIGGLIKTDEMITKSGVPLLKDIPLLGNLFKHSSKKLMNLDLLIFITPTIVEGPAASVLAAPPGYVEKAEPVAKLEAPAPAEKAK